MLTDEQAYAECVMAGVDFRDDDRNTYFDLDAYACGQLIAFVEMDGDFISTVDSNFHLSPVTPDVITRALRHAKAQAADRYAAWKENVYDRTDR